MTNPLTKVRSRLERTTRRNATVGRSGEPRLPLVLISYNRGEMLRGVVDEYRRQSVPVDIVVHDNGSDDPRTLDVLLQLEREGVTVVRRPAISSTDELALVDETVQEIFRGRAPAPYAVSDCDVSLGQSASETLAACLDLLAETPDLECVGPMLRVDDVPRSYPLYVPLMNRHVGAFWSREPHWSAPRGRLVAFQRASIATTLAVYRAGTTFRHVSPGARLYHPYSARHLEWYPDEHDVSTYRSSIDGSAISNWSNPARERSNRQVKLEHTTFRDVTETDDGSLTTVTRPVPPPVA
ncbi:glycosyltransferase family 2 protein [Isoptericola variabilis]|uniref:glycosyltransferase family 2 protein n=1 Tax=Isoptericola variabilis TaxID=139208 RepID=UPI003D1F78B7